MCLHRVPDLVNPLHCAVWLVPCSLWGDGVAAPYAAGGLQILQGCNPALIASAIVMRCDTFFTLRQVAKWYFCPRVFCKPFVPLKNLTEQEWLRL